MSIYLNTGDLNFQSSANNSGYEFVYANKALPNDGNKYYCEILVNELNTTIGNEWAIDYFGIGVSEFGAIIDYTHIYGDKSNEYAYTSNGCLASKSKNCIEYSGEPYKQGDVISIIIDTSKKNIEFYKNGVNQGIAFSDVNNINNIVVGIKGYSKETKWNISANFGNKIFNYKPPKDCLAYDGSIPKFKYYLIQNKNNNLFKINGGVVTDLGVISPTEDLFKSQGMDTIPQLTEDILSQIGDFKLLKWTDSEETEHQVNMQGDYKDKLFKCIDGCKILTWTDNANEIEPKLTYECDPYRPIDKLEDNFKILMYKE